MALFGRDRDSRACRSAARALSHRWAFSTAGQREAGRWAVGSNWHPLAGFRR
jgi:hypothetical protein